LRAHGCDDVRDGIEHDLGPVAHDVVAAALGEDGAPVRRGGDEVAMRLANRLDLLGRLDPRPLGDDVDGRRRGWISTCLSRATVAGYASMTGIITLASSGAACSSAENCGLYLASRRVVWVSSKKPARLASTRTIPAMRGSVAATTVATNPP